MSLSWLPNAISALRITLVAPILVLIFHESYATALVLFVIAGFSDGFDGYLARRFGWHTRLGALLDPVADKLLVSGLFVTLAITGDIPVWLAVVVLVRDLVIVIGAVTYQFIIGPVEGEPTRVSKLNTALQLLFLFFVISRSSHDWPQEITITILGAAVFVTVVISGIDYVWSWSARARKGK